MKKKLAWIIALVALIAICLGWVFFRPAREMILTGIVTTDEVIVSSDVQGPLERLLVNQGDPVRTNQLLGLIQPQEWKADAAFYGDSQKQSAAQVVQAQADLRLAEAQTSNQIWQAQATFEASQAQVKQAQADLEIARLNFERESDLYKKQVESIQNYDQMRTAYDAVKARVETYKKQALAAEAAVGVARASADQVAARRAAVQASVHQLDAAGAQRQKADVRLGYTEIRAPIEGIVNVRAALEGEIVMPGQAIVTLVDPNDFWVRADVEETYIARIHLGDKFQVRLPSGELKTGTVFYRAIDADYATQRDVSRTKRDIKTFQIRLRCDNSDRSLALGMTAYVLLPETITHGGR
ncbi:MAG TPA: efflux RND transporter periplasmic adaptor subunit [Verrucomicrobiae bacterium]|nr:efflux RND transporter periplasmic adaptor subunit [Verrucomicrobiae bacterium]